MLFPGKVAEAPGSQSCLAPVRGELRRVLPPRARARVTRQGEPPVSGRAVRGCGAHRAEPAAARRHPAAPPSRPAPASDTSEVFRGVLKVISKMLEENEKFRGRLLTCRQFNTEGSDVNQSSQNEASCMDRDESIFGWV